MLQVILDVVKSVLYTTIQWSQTTRLCCSISDKNDCIRFILGFLLKREFLYRGRKKVIKSM